MSHFEQYDHVLGEEFDDYEDRRRCSSCRTTPGLRGSRTRRPGDCVRTLSNANIIFLIVLMVALAAATVWLIHGSGYNNNSNIDGSRSVATDPSQENKRLKKMQKPPLIERLCHMVWPSKSKSIRRGRCRQYQKPDRSNGCSRRSRYTIF